MKTVPAVLPEGGPERTHLPLPPTHYTQTLARTPDKPKARTDFFVKESQSPGLSWRDGEFMTYSFIKQ